MLLRNFNKGKGLVVGKRVPQLPGRLLMLMFEGKVDAALKLVSDHSVRGGIMHMRDILDGKSVR